MMGLCGTIRGDETDSDNDERLRRPPQMWAVAAEKYASDVVSV